MVRTVVMMIGEFDFDDLFHNQDIKYASISYIFFVVFVLIMTIIVMNLLVISQSALKMPYETTLFTGRSRRRRYQGRTGEGSAYKTGDDGRVGSRRRTSIARAHTPTVYHRPKRHEAQYSSLQPAGVIDAINLQRRRSYEYGKHYKAAFRLSERIFSRKVLTKLLTFSKTTNAK